MMKLKLGWFRNKELQHSPDRTLTVAQRQPYKDLEQLSLTPACRLSKPLSRSLQRLLSGAIVTSLSVVSILGVGAGIPAAAASRMTLKLGPFEQSVDIADLEEFAQTGEISAALKPYSMLLTPQVQQLLNKRLQVDPDIADKFIDDLLRSADGNQLIRQIRAAIPNSTIEQVRLGLALALRQTNGLSAINFLRFYPEDNITIDASSAIGIALQLNVPNAKSQAVNYLLERELVVPNASFRAPFNPSLPGQERVKKQTLSFADEQRNRNIVADIYWDEIATGPLVVISHGFASNRAFLAYLARHLASHGLTVVALDHPDSYITGLNPAAIPTSLSKLLPATEFIDRPQDISFLLDRLGELNQQPGALEGKLNTEQVSVIGHSLGGYTALALAGAEVNLDDLRQFCKQRQVLSRSGGDWLQCAAADLPRRRLQMRDSRVAQVMALNPVSGQLFGSRGLSQVTIPTLVWTGTGDTLTPSLSHQLRAFSQLGGSKYLVSAIGSTHLSITDPENLNPQLAQSTLVPEVTGKEAYPVRQLLRGVSLAFVKQLTPEARTYEPFLTAGYAQSLSTPQLRMRLNRQLPATINAFLEVP